MNFPLYIAKRYLFAKKSNNVINIITRIAIIGVAVGSMALITVLSVFNGIEGLVISMYNAFDPQIKITAAEGKVFNPKEIYNIKQHPGVLYFTEVLEENALIKYRDKQYIGTIKGVDENFLPMSRLDTLLTEGIFGFENTKEDHAVVGYGIAANLDINLLNIATPLYIYVPKRTASINSGPEEAFNVMPVYPSGIFSVQYEFDSKYIIVPLDFARQLLLYENEVSAVELGLKDGFDAVKVAEELQMQLGEKYVVKDRFKQNDALYKIMKSEKLAIYLILTFILIIAAFNVIGSITMLIIDKKADIIILKNMGATATQIQKIFFVEGILISAFGAVIGLIAGLLLCLAQQHFGLIKLHGTFAMDAYPVIIKTGDFVLVLFTVLLIGTILSFIPARKTARSIGIVFNNSVSED
ncbi:MAG: ABC transporter permease [Bacteroidia bacterium]